MANYIISIQTPPGGPLSLPTPSNPSPSGNPAIFNDAMVVRRRVFIEEQNIDENAEIDDDDARSWHWVLYTDSSSQINGSTGQENATENGDRNPKPVAVIRLVPPPHAPHEVVSHPEKANSLPKYDLSHEPYVKLTRVAVLPEYRGLGLGRKVVDAALEWAEHHGGDTEDAYARVTGEQERKKWEGLVLVHAQVEVEEMYKRLGFETDEGLGRWDEEGIDH
ncbi:acetyltransferase, GNAT family, partial [Aspergillus sclerotialis]